MPRQEWVGIEPMGEVFLLTFLFIGLVRYGDFSAMWLVSSGANIGRRAKGFGPTRSLSGWRIRALGTRWRRGLRV
jgi:hypothetical protein